MENYGEILYGHYGVYTTKRYPESDNVAPGPQNNDIKCGEEDSCNQVLALCEENSSDYLWSCYCGQQKETEVSEGYRHTVYIPYTYKALEDIDWLLFFPFVDEHECIAYLSDQKQFSASSRREMIDFSKDVERPSVNISQELLTELVCFCVAQKKVRGKRFLYFLVPQEVVEYQKYCRDVIKQLLDAMPVGFRKGLKIATNMPFYKELSCHILFKRDGKKDMKNSIRIEGEFDHSFLKESILSDNIRSLLNNCVQDREYLRNCNELAEKHGEDESVSAEELYEFCFKVLELRKEPSCQRFLKACSQLLEGNNKKWKADIIHDFIDKQKSRFTWTEIAIWQDEEVEKAATPEELFRSMEPYKNLLTGFNTKDKKLSEEFAKKISKKIRFVEANASEVNGGFDRYREELRQYFSDENIEIILNSMAAEDTSRFLPETQEPSWTFDVGNLLNEYRMNPDYKIIEKVFNVIGENRPERQEILAEISRVIKDSFEKWDYRRSYEDIIAIYQSFSAHLSNEETRIYLEEEELKATFYTCLEEGLRKCIEIYRNFKSVCSALDIAYCWKEYFSSCMIFLNQVYGIINNLLCIKSLSDGEKITIYSKLLKLYGNNRDFMDLLKKGLDEKISEDELTEGMDSFETYFFRLRKRYPFCKSIDIYKNKIVKKILTDWPLNRRSFPAFLSAVVAVEGRTVEEMAKDDNEALDFYRNECTIFFKDHAGIVMDRYSSLSRMYQELLYYSKIFEQEYVTLCFLPSVTKGDYRKNCGILGKKERFHVRSILKFLPTVIMEDKNASSQLDDKDEDYRRCAKFFAEASKNRPKIGGNVIVSFAMFSLAVALVFFCIHISKSKDEVIDPGPQPSPPDNNVVNSDVINIEMTKKIEEMLSHLESEDMIEPKIIWSDSENMSRKGIGWWQRAKYRFSYNELKRYPVSRLIESGEIFNEQGQAVREYLTLNIFMEIREANKGEAYILKNVDFYDARNSAELFQGLYLEEPLILLTYTHGGTGDIINTVYCYNKENDKFCTFNELYGDNIDADNASKQMFDLADKLNNHKELIIRTTRTRNIENALEEIEQWQLQQQQLNEQQPQEEQAPPEE